MLTFKPKTRSTSHQYSSPEDLLPECLVAIKAFKRLTPKIRDRLQKLIDDPPVSITSRSRLIDHLQNNVFALGRGAHSDEQRRSVLGWSEQEIKDLSAKTNSRAIKGYRKKYGRSTSFTKEYWMIKGLSEEEAIKKVSKLQSANSKRVPIEIKKRGLKNLISSKHYDGLSLDEAQAKLSAHQREQSKRRIEYWVKRGRTAEQAKAEVTRHQEEQSKFHSSYWMKRGLSKEEADQRSLDEAIKNYSSNTRLSKQSQRFFDKIRSALPTRQFLYGKNEIPFSATKLGKNRRCFFLDFYEPSTKLSIEFDGHWWHKDTSVQDEERDKFLLQEYGVKVLRISSKVPEQESVNTALQFLSEGIQ